MQRSSGAETIIRNMTAYIRTDKITPDLISKGGFSQTCRSQVQRGSGAETNIRHMSVCIRTDGVVECLA